MGAGRKWWLTASVASKIALEGALASAVAFSAAGAASWEQSQVFWAAGCKKNGYNLITLGSCKAAHLVFSSNFAKRRLLAAHTAIALLPRSHAACPCIELLTAHAVNAGQARRAAANLAAAFPFVPGAGHAVKSTHHR